jgi:predicted histone-like DNA-binding protein
MAIKFKVIEKAQPGVAGGGVKKFYASVKVQGEANIDELTRSIEKISTVSGADIRAVLYALVDVISQDLSQGRIVRLGDLGYLRVSLSSEGKDSAEEVSASSIRGAKYIFTPGISLKNTLKTLTFQKA